MSIQLVLFDVGGVFFEWKDRWLFNHVANTFELSEMRLTEECKKMFSFMRTGKMSEKRMWEKVGRRINSDAIINANHSLIRDFFKSKIIIDDSVLEIVRELQKNGTRAGILSNTMAVMHSAVRELIDMKYFDYEFLSYKIGIEKPNEMIFKYVIEKTPFEKEEILFVDDRMSNIHAARNHGMNAVKFINSSYLNRDLKNSAIL